MSLTGKTAVVLGGSGFYGAAVARMLAGEGVRVALGGRSREKLEELEAEIRASGGEALVGLPGEELGTFTVVEGGSGIEEGAER